MIPTDVAGLELWLDADAITGLSDDDTVTTWEDQSGNNNDYTGNNAAITYQTNELNGLPIVKMEVGGFTGSVSLSNPFSIFYVGRYTVGGSSPRRAVQSSAPPDWLLGPYNAAWQWFSGGFAASGGAAGTDWVAHGVIQETAFGRHFVYDLDTNALPTINGRASPVAIGTLRLGNAGNVNETFGGELAEIVAYSALITTAERIGITDYFREKWGGIVASSGEDPNTGARIAREAAVVAVVDIDAEARIGREALVVGHTLPSEEVDMRTGRLSIMVAISRPHGWD